MTILITERQYIYVRLAVEETGSYGAGNGGMDCSYSVYDPTGVLEGDLTISCKNTKLVDMLHSLRVHQSQPSVLDRPLPSHVAATPPAPSQATSTTPSVTSIPYGRVQPLPGLSGGRRPVDVAPDVSAGALISDLAQIFGVMDPFTLSMASTIDDLLAPQGK